MEFDIDLFDDEYNADDIEDYDPEEVVAALELIGMPLSEIVVRNYDMDEAFLRLTQRRCPKDMWQYLTVAELTMLLSDASELIIAGTMMPLLDGLIVRSREKAVVYEFMTVKMPDGTALFKQIEEAMSIVKDNNNLFLVVGDCGRGHSNRLRREDMINVLVAVYNAVFLHLTGSLGIANCKEDVMKKLGLYC